MQKTVHTFLVPLLGLLVTSSSCRQKNPTPSASKEQAEDLMERHRGAMGTLKERVGIEGKEMGADTVDKNDSLETLPKSDLDSLKKT